MGRFNKVFIVAPAGAVTGGPELSHQLAACLRAQGQDAYMAYYPFEGEHECPAPYLKYGVPSAKIDDEFGNAVVIPEIYTAFAAGFKKAQPVIWWMSVDNYLYSGRLSWFWLRRKILELLAVLRGRRNPSVASMGKLQHLAQSVYAQRFLASFGLESHVVSDYLNEEHFESKSTHVKERQIAFNPKKGKRVTNRLIRANPDIKFVPIQGLSASGVKELLARSMVYIDFGHHPGKDRMPREAAMAGCCVVTGRRGSAAVAEDVFIPEKYKLDEYASDFDASFREIVLSIFDNYEASASEFSAYRDKIRNEKNVFEAEVRRYFCA